MYNGFLLIYRYGSLFCSTSKSSDVTLVLEKRWSHNKHIKQNTHKTLFNARLFCESPFDTMLILYIA